MLNQALMTSKRPDWCTPENVLTLVRGFAGGQICCDPCSNPRSTVNAKREYQLERKENGLEQDWESLTYLNPGYGVGLKSWVEKARKEWMVRGVETIALLPARTDTLWFQECWKAPAICFWKGRIKFVGGEEATSAPFPSVLVYWGPRALEFCGQFDGVGACRRPDQKF